MDDQLEGLANLWTWFAEAQFRDNSPLYEKICLSVARDEQLLELVRSAPPSGHLPISLLAAVHYQLLAGFQHPLAEVYAGRSHADPFPLFREVCLARHAEIAELLATRVVQTNDCGRCALIVPGILWISGHIEGPFGLIDVGASAGLNLLCDRYQINYDDYGTIGPSDSPVIINCHVVGGEPPIAGHMPEIVARIGIDHSPVDLSSEDDVRWLRACVWPDTGRLERVEASIRLAQGDPPTVIAGDAIETLPSVLADLPAGTAALVMTTWSFSYFSLEQRSQFLEVLENEATNRPVVWLMADHIGTVGELVVDTQSKDLPQDTDALFSMVWTDGTRQSQLLAIIQSHGGWIDWRGPEI